MISLDQYFGHKKHTEDHEVAAADLLTRREALRQEYYAATGAEPDIDPDTGTEISGAKNGTGDGGFRLSTATTGAPDSSHKQACGIDDSDQQNKFDAWLDQFEDGHGGNSKLEEHGLYREHPSKTNTWVHLTTRAPHSGKRTFMP
jgi:hypothetical protein